MFFTTQTRSWSRVLEMIIFSIGIILFCSGVTKCTNTGGKDQGEAMEMPKKPIKEVLKAYTHQLMSLPGVVGTAQGLCDGQSCIKVFVSKKTPELEQKIPKMLEGYPVVIEETGKIKALPDSSQ